jgi:tetratricopeptide (TPR) repeat protein
MNFDKKKYIFIAVAAILLMATIYAISSLVTQGTPTVKSQNEFLKEANRLHNDSLFEEAVEPYMKACVMNGQESLAKYNTAVNSIMVNYPALANMFNEEGYKPDSAQIIALNAAIKKLDEAGVGLSDTARYSSVYQNIGVVKHMSNELDAAAEAYKEALRKNPADEDARYNLAVILYQKQKNDQNQNQQNQQNQQDEQQEQEQQQQQQQQQQQEQNKDEKQQDEKEIEEEKEKIEQMLKALMQDEKDIREKMEKAQKANQKTLEKNW